MQLPVREGDVLSGKYRIDKIIGYGGMGVVVSAYHLQLDERVALKFLLPQALRNPDTMARLVREARAASKIKNEHVARMIDVCWFESGAPYLVMEYLEGQELAAVIRTRGSLPLEAATDLVLQICEALAEAHAHGIVHRDLKPANLFLVRGADGLPCVKVLDFGISKMRAADSSGGMSLTTPSMIMGSPLYMAPEQLSSSRDVDHRIDIWALGVIYYEMLSGQLPFFADTMPELCVRILQHPATPLSQTRPDLPINVQTVIGRCLEKDRTARYATIADLAHDLEPFASKRAQLSMDRIRRFGQSTAAGVAASGGWDRAGLGGTIQATTASYTSRGSKARRRAWLPMMLAAAVVVAVTFAWLGLRWRRGTDLLDGSLAHSAAPALPAAVTPPAPIMPPAPETTPGSGTARTPDVTHAPEMGSALPTPSSSVKGPASTLAPASAASATRPLSATGLSASVSPAASPPASPPAQRARNTQQRPALKDGHRDNGAELFSDSK